MTSSVEDFNELRRTELAMGGVTFQCTEYGHQDMPSIRFKNNALGLPIDLVTGLINLSYQHPDQKQAILDALSPFQIMSKLWVTQVLCDALSMEGVQTEHQFVLLGSWYGQQAHLLARNSKVRMKDTILVDMDPRAMALAFLMGIADPFGAKSIKQRIPADIFYFDKWQTDIHPDFMDRDPQSVYVWNGLEHFEPETVKWFIARHPHATFCLQGTSMPADDHKFLCKDIQDLLEYVPEDHVDNVRYAGELETNFGSRYMVIFTGNPY